MVSCEHSESGSEGILKICVPFEDRPEDILAALGNVLRSVKLILEVS